MAVGKAVIRYRVISVGIRSDVTEMTQKQTTMRVIVVGGCEVWEEEVLDEALWKGSEG